MKKRYTKTMIDFTNKKVIEYPYPITIVEECFDDKTLGKLIEEYPDVSGEQTVMGGRKNLKAGEWLSEYPTWKQFYDYLNDESLFQSMINDHSEELEKWDSVITNRNSLDTDCFLYLDIATATDGYYREIHRDTDKRIWNFLIFLNDKDWEGGDFLIHSSDKMSMYPRQIFDTSMFDLPVEKVIEAKKNRGVFFLSVPNSYHSVSVQSKTNTPRNFLYGSYSYRGGDVFNKRSK